MKIKQPLLPILLFCLSLLPLYLLATEEKLPPAGGQKVEKITVEQPEPPVEMEQIFKTSEEHMEEELFRNAQASDVVGSRPDPDGTPTKVKVALFIKDISSLDDTEQTFTANATLILRWIDPRLKNPSKEVQKVPLDSIWNPLISIVNERNLKTQHDESVFVQSEGHVLYVQVYSGTFTVPLNLRNFPFDKHRLFLNVQSYYSPEDVTFIIDEHLTGWSEKLSIPDWIVSQGEAKVSSAYWKLQDRDRALFQFSFNIERLLGFYLWKIMLPLTLIVFMSWGVFWIDPRRLEAQVALSATTFLTLFAFQFAIAALLPRIAYLTRMDRYTMLCSLLVFLTIIKAIITSYFVKNEELEKAKTIDFWCRILFPVAFIAILLFSFYL